MQPFTSQTLENQPKQLGSDSDLWSILQDTLEARKVFYILSERTLHGLSARHTESVCGTQFPSAYSQATFNLAGHQGPLLSEEQVPAKKMH